MRTPHAIAIVVSLFLAVGCSSAGNLRAPNPSDLNILKSSKNQRTYRADYDTTFRAAVDTLRRIDDTSARMVQYDAGLIVFKKANEAGTITARVKKLDEQTTHVELTAKDQRRYWFDDGDEQTRDAFFAMLDELLGSTPVAESPGEAVTEEPATAAEEPAAAAEVEAPQDQGRQAVLTQVSQRLGLDENAPLLAKLSSAELATLNERLNALGATSEETHAIATRCAACYIDLARSYHDQGEYSQAEEALKVAIEVDPENAQAHCNLGEIYKHLHRFDDALRELNTARELNPDLPDTYVNLGIIYDDYVVDDQKAIENYRKYLELGGTDKQVPEWIDKIEKESS
jgi:tetratricopeptide (TPR) repeat protein